MNGPTMNDFQVFNVEILHIGLKTKMYFVLYND